MRNEALVKRDGETKTEHNAIIKVSINVKKKKKLLVFKLYFHKMSFKSKSYRVLK